MRRKSWHSQRFGGLQSELRRLDVFGAPFLSSKQASFSGTKIRLDHKTLNDWPDIDKRLALSMIKNATWTSHQDSA